MTSLLQRIRWWPLAVARWLPAWLPAWLRRRCDVKHATGAWRAGLTVVIPDRNTPDLLAECLAALMVALAEIDEPWQVIVSTSDTPAATYAPLARRYPQLEWCHSENGLGYSRAIAQAMSAIRYDHTYLLNNDMRLHVDALARVLECRDTDVFAVASQIFMADATVRREETGLTACNGFPGNTRLFDVEPGDDSRVRTHLYGGGGSSLFRSAPLRDYVRQSVVYEPAYWEDVEWGLRAWRDGWRVLFCPSSKTVHRHRATVSRIFAAHEIDRIFQRNGLWFDLRNDDGRSLAERLPVLCRNPHSAAETQRWSFAVATLAAQLRCHGQAQPDHWFIARQSIRMADARALDARQRVLFVSDQTLLPAGSPRSRGVMQQLAQLSERVNVAVVARQGDTYVNEAIGSANFLSSLWLFDTEPADDADQLIDRGLPAVLHEAMQKAQLSLQPDWILLDDGVGGCAAFRHQAGIWHAANEESTSPADSGSRNLQAFLHFLHGQATEHRSQREAEQLV